jgi:hypothetical protein
VSQAGATTPAANHAVTTYTENSPGANATELQKVSNFSQEILGRPVPDLLAHVAARIADGICREQMNHVVKVSISGTADGQRRVARKTYREMQVCDHASPFSNACLRLQNSTRHGVATHTNSTRRIWDVYVATSQLQKLRAASTASCRELTPSLR